MLRGRQAIKAIALLFSILISDVSQAQVMANTAFWKHRVASVQFTTSAQTILAGLCSGVATVGNYNASGALTAVSSNLTVSLSSTGTTTYYSDSNCTTSISNITITTGNSTASFYFVEATVASITLTASATNYTSGTQSETVNTNPYVWTGGGANSLWATGGNWSGGSAPGSSNIALFNSTCSSNCSPTLGANISIGGIRMDTGYSGTFTQSSSYTITTSTGGWVQRAGTFTGSSSGGSITLGGHFVLAGGTFTSTSGTLTQNSSLNPVSFIVSGSPTFSANSGTIALTSAGYRSHPMTPGSVTYNNVSFAGYMDTYDFGGNTMTIGGNLSYGETSGGMYLNTGTLSVAGNVTGSAACGGTASIKLTGNASGQTVSSGSTSCPILGLELATGTNPVTFSGTVPISGNYTVTSAGTVTTTGSTLVFVGTGYASVTIKPGSIAYNHVQFNGYSTTFDFASGTMTINGNLTIGNNSGNGNDSGIYNNGTLNVAGNITTTSSSINGVGGSVLVKMVGNASGQTITSSSTYAYNGVPNLEIAAGANNVTFSGDVWVRGNYKLTSAGTLTTTGSTLRIANGGTSTFDGGTKTYNDVVFYDTWAGATYNMGSSTLNVGGNLTLNSTQGYAVYMNSGTLSLAKNFTSIGSSSNGGSAAVNFVGSTNQTITSTSNGTFPTGNVTVNTTAGAKLLLGSAVSLNATGQNFTVTAGGVDMAGYAFTLKALALNSNTLTKNGGTLTVNGTTVGTGSLYGGTVAP